MHQETKFGPRLGPALCLFEFLFYVDWNALSNEKPKLQAMVSGYSNLQTK